MTSRLRTPVPAMPKGVVTLRYAFVLLQGDDTVPVGQLTLPDSKGMLKAKAFFILALIFVMGVIVYNVWAS